MNEAAGKTWVSDYLLRIGAERPRSGDLEALPELHRRHLYAVPFENLSVHLGEEIVLEDEALVAKIVERRRGGFCYELNGAFAALLTALGYEVDILAGRVHTPEGLGIPHDHMALRVGPWLVDVGFGRHSIHPLRLDERGEQADPAGTFRIVETPDGDLDVLKDGGPEYRLWTRPQALPDFAAGCWWHQTSPRSHFTRSLVCSLPSDDGDGDGAGTGRVTLSGRKLVRTVAGKREERELDGDAEVLDAYRSHFGIVLDRVPGIGRAG